MSRSLRALILLVFVASCGSRDYSAPRNLDNACSIIDQRPKYLPAMRAAERKWGVPVSVQMATIYQESKFIGNARTPVQYTLGVIPMGRQSSAFGYSQALDATWDEYRLAESRRSAKRDRINDATDFMGWYMNQTRERNGVSLTDARNQYLAYHEGHTGFKNASYNRKPWLVNVASKVGSRSEMYRAQLPGCRRLR